MKAWNETLMSRSYRDHQRGNVWKDMSRFQWRATFIIMFIIILFLGPFFIAAMPALSAKLIMAGIFIAAEVGLLYLAVIYYRKRK